MSFWTVAMQIVAVSLPIALGWALGKLDVVDRALNDGLSRLVMKVALPASIVASIHGSEALPAHGALISLIVVTALTFVVAVVVSLALCAAMRVPARDAASYRFAIAFGNCGFIGLPVISSILGAHALLYAAVALIPANIALFTGGAILFSHEESTSLLRRLRSAVLSLRTPTFFASVIVLVLALMSVTDLGVVGESLAIVGQAATPLALIVTGVSIAQYRPVEMVGNPRAYLAAAGRLVVVPLACIAVTAPMGLDPLVRAVVVFENSMPVATVGVLFCMQAGDDAMPMSQTTFLSIVGSVATIPIVTLLVGA